MSITDGSTSYIITGRQEDSSYSITATATNAAGSSAVSNTVTAVTGEAGYTFLAYLHSISEVIFVVFYLIAPSAAPTPVSVSEVTSSSITVQWGAVDCIHRNGYITGYSVRYGIQTKSVSGGGSTQTIIFGLTPSTEYSIEVAAVNSAGTGVYSNAIMQITQGRVS